MLIVKEDKTRDVSEGQVFVELTKNRGIDVINCDRLGYWCDKAHLSHFLTEIGKIFTEEEKIKLLGIKTEAKSDFITLDTVNSNKISLRKDDIVTLKEDGKSYDNSKHTIVDTKQGKSWNIKNSVEEILELLKQK